MRISDCINEIIYKFEYAKFANPKMNYLKPSTGDNSAEHDSVNESMIAEAFGTKLNSDKSELVTFMAKYL